MTNTLTPNDWFDQFVVTTETETRSSPVRTVGIDRSPLFMLAAAGNRYARIFTRLLLTRYGVGVMTWRMLVQLAQAPGASVADASRNTGIDKAAVSRTLSAMAVDGLVQTQARASDSRRKSWYLTLAGHDLHDTILPLSIEMHNRLLGDLDQTDIAELRRLLLQFHASLGRLENDLNQGPDL